MGNLSNKVNYWTDARYSIVKFTEREFVMSYTDWMKLQFPETNTWTAVEISAAINSAKDSSHSTTMFLGPLSVLAALLTIGYLRVNFSVEHFVGLLGWAAMLGLFIGIGILCRVVNVLVTKSFLRKWVKEV